MAMAKPSLAAQRDDVDAEEDEPTVVVVAVGDDGVELLVAD